MHSSKAEPPHRPVAHILVIEDNAADVQLLRLAIEEHQYPFRLTVLKDGAEALAFVARQRQQSTREPEPCVIVLDLHLPKHDGLAVLAEIRRTPALMHIHVVVLTSSVMPFEIRKAQELGIAWYREKPADFSDLCAIAGRILDFCNQSAVDAA